MVSVLMETVPSWCGAQLKAQEQIYFTFTWTRYRTMYPQIRVGLAVSTGGNTVS
jgi:hypothetical protein